MRKFKTFRYRGKNCINDGVHTEFLKRRLRYSGGFHKNLTLPQPRNLSEVKLLSSFIFGIELGVKFDRIYDSFLRELRDKKFERKHKLNMLSPDSKDYFEGSYNGKKPLLYLSYECTIRHDEYYDNSFNYEVFDSCYELDSSFWQHCIGELGTGGIGAYSYGQITVTSLKERERLLNMINNPEQEPSASFIKKLNSLKLKDKKFDVVTV